MTGAPVRAQPKPAGTQRQGNAQLEPHRKQSVGEHWPQPLLQRDARKRADNSIDLLAVADHDEQRDRLRAKPGRESWIRVNIDLRDLEMPCVPFGKVFKHRRDHPTRPAPRRPEIHHHRHRRRRLGHKRIAVRVDDPRQRGLAPRASRDPPRDRANAIARVTGRAADGGHDHQSRTRRSRGRLADQPPEGAWGCVPAAT